MLQPERSAAFAASSFLAGGTFGRVYQASRLESAAPGLPGESAGGAPRRAGEASQLVIKESFIATEAMLCECNAALGALHGDGAISGPISRSRELAMLQSLPQRIDMLQPIGGADVAMPSLLGSAPWLLPAIVPP